MELLLYSALLEKPFCFLACAGQKRQRPREEEFWEVTVRVDAIRKQGRLEEPTNDEGKPSMNQIGGYYVNWLCEQQRGLITKHTQSQ